MKNHWLELHRSKRNWWQAEFSRSGSFVLNPTRVSLDDKTNNLLCGDLDGLFHLTIIFPVANNEAVSFLKTSRGSMKNIYGRLRLRQGVWPIVCDKESYELTDLSYVSSRGGWISNDLHFEFTCSHIRKYSKGG